VRHRFTMSLRVAVCVVLLAGSLVASAAPARAHTAPPSTWWSISGHPGPAKPWLDPEVSFDGSTFWWHMSYEGGCGTTNALTYRYALPTWRRIDQNGVPGP